ncbi:hypothetical protein FRB93_011217 [Tulasnella sp. JGI-2019a]|nr:hypothetical protein FRB93_011217 [Tulasnella sp. JGI-2019a]
MAAVGASGFVPTPGSPLCGSSWAIGGRIPLVFTDEGAGSTLRYCLCNAELSQDPIAQPMYRRRNERLHSTAAFGVGMNGALVETHRPIYSPIHLALWTYGRGYDVCEAVDGLWSLVAQPAVVIF